MTRSHWHSSSQGQSLTPDVAIVGAGIAGISAALAFDRRGLRVAILEQGTIASGASSRNAGFLMRGAADHYVDAIRLYGRPAAKDLWKWTEDNLADLRREGIEDLPSYRAIPSALVALNPEQAEQLRRSAELLREDGFDAPWTTDPPSDDDTLWQNARPAGALLNPHDASINPIHLVRFLASKLSTNAALYEHQPVLQIVTPGMSESSSESPGSAHLYTLHTPTLTVTTPRILLCTNAYTPLLIPALKNIITPRRGQMLAVANSPLPPGTKRPIHLACSYYANHGSEYLRQAADADGGAIVIGGCRTYFADREVGYHDATTDEVQCALEDFAARMLGPRWSATGITTRWSGVMGFSPDGLPLVGPISCLTPPSARPTDSPPSNLWLCGAFTGHGMSMAYRTAHAAAAAMLDGTPPPFPLSRVLG